MKHLLVATVLACLLVANAQMQSCTTSGTYVIETPSGVFGCNGYGNDVNITWKLTSDKARLIDFLTFDTEAQYDVVKVIADGKTYGPFSGTTIPGQIIVNGGVVLVTFTTDPSNIRSGFRIVMNEFPAPLDLRSAQAHTVTEQRPGGFVYLAFPHNAYGKGLHLRVDIFSYSGIQEPGVFVGVNRVPILEKFDHKNDTVHTGGDHYVNLLTIEKPANGRYYFGIFLYGTAAKLTVTATWTYDVPLLINGVKVNKQTNSAAGDYYQLQTAYGTGRLTFQVSRQVPGGYPLVYIRRGVIPTADNYEYVMDTRIQSYISLPIVDPNPYGNQSPNPGTYVVHVVADSGSAGYILQADWH